MRVSSTCVCVMCVCVCVYVCVCVFVCSMCVLWVYVYVMTVYVCYVQCVCDVCVPCVCAVFYVYVCMFVLCVLCVCVCDMYEFVGGAMAALEAIYLQGEHRLGERLVLVTFGCPRVGNSRFQKVFRSVIRYLL